MYGMIGAVIFIVVFLAVLGVSLGMPWLPPGYMIFDVLNIPAVDYPVLGIPAYLLFSIVNGVVYGFIIWLIYSVVAAATGKGKKDQQIS
ncbi:hypothetical protein KEJ18_06760 [Candidatus Bathyarchaeota archaeon]|nr:hypothetical protein [Candidatus Bathyarchaeota archaeon]